MLGGTKGTSVVVLLSSAVAVIFFIASPPLIRYNQSKLVVDRLWKPEELAIYNGTDANLPILLAIFGSVFDVTKGKSHYGPGGSYSLFLAVPRTWSVVLLSVCSFPIFLIHACRRSWSFWHCLQVMKHYTFSNLSENSQRFVAAFFHLISLLAETFVFIYMGFDIAMEKHSWSHVGFIFFSILFIVIARAANVFGCAYLINLVRPADRQMPVKHQKALWYSGSTGTMLEALQVVGDANGGPLGESFDGNTGYIAPSYDEGASSGSRLKMRLKEFHKSTASFTALDRNYLTQFFTAQNGDGEEEFDELVPISRGGRGFLGR